MAITNRVVADVEIEIKGQYTSGRVPSENAFKNSYIGVKQLSCEFSVDRLVALLEEYCDCEDQFRMPPFTLEYTPEYYPGEPAWRLADDIDGNTLAYVTFRDSRDHRTGKNRQVLDIFFDV